MSSTSHDRGGSGRKGTKRPIEPCGTKPPEIYVRLADLGYYGPSYAKASIRIRSGKYKYLVWREGKTMRWLYLGKAKERV